MVFLESESLYTVEYTANHQKQIVKQPGYSSGSEPLELRFLLQNEPTTRAHMVIALATIAWCTGFRTGFRSGLRTVWH